MVEFIHHYTVDSPDSEGRFLVGSDQVVDVFYYDASQETWRRDYSDVGNPFFNGDFNETTVTGSRPNVPGHYWYETGTDATATDRFFKFGKIPFDHASNVLARQGTRLTNTATSRGAINNVHKDYLARTANDTSEHLTNTFPSSYDSSAGLDVFWATTSGTGGANGAAGHGVAAWTLDNITDVAGFYIDSYDCDVISEAAARSAAVGTYIIEVATSGTGLSSSVYSVVASGTRTLGDIHPIWVQITPTPAKHVRIRFRNSGNASFSTMGKFYVYTQAVIDAGGMGMIVMNVNDSNVVPVLSTGGSNRTFELNQRIDLTNIDRIFFNVRDHAFRSTDIAKFSIEGTSVAPLNYGSPVAADIIVTNEVFSFSVTTTAFGADSIFKISKRISNLNLAGNNALTMVSNFSAVPGWYTEAPSAKRGSKAAFPEKTVIVCDAKGLSIIDASDLTLWMRFDMGHKKMLRERPVKAMAINGTVYVATMSGLFMIRFHHNTCQRLDGKGPRVRYGIERRNVNDYNSEEWLNTSDSAIPDWMRHTFMFETSVPVLPGYCIYDLSVGSDSVFGTYVFLATDRGLILYNGAVGGSGVTFSSLDNTPVYDVKVVNGTVWYLQGEGDEQVLKFLPTVSSAATAGFSPTNTYNKEVRHAYDLVEDIGTGIWEIIQQDPGMHVVGGEALTISGTHTAAGATGIILKGTLPERSFVAKVKVKIKNFPPDARGALRFGVCRDYHPMGPLSLDSDLGATTRAGFFVSAFNADPYGWPLLESTPFTARSLGADRGWFYSAQTPDEGTSSEDTTKLAIPVASGINFRNYNGRTTAAPIFAEDLNRFSSIPAQVRDFTAKVKAQLVSGFSAPISATTNANPNAFFGITRKDQLAPGTGGGGNYIDGAMVVTGNTTFSGVLVYTTGSYSSTNLIQSTTLTHPKIGVISPDSTGTTTSPYREWRLDYNSGTNGITCFLDGASVGSITGTTYSAPHRLGLVFGVGSHGASTGTNFNRFATFGHLDVSYPTLVSGSRYKYGMEVASLLTGDLHQVAAVYPTYSGISKSSDVTPASGTLTTVAGLFDGNTTTGVLAVVQNLSIGVALDAPHTVEALRIYDSVPSTTGWSSTASKRVDVRYSNDNQNWTFFKRYDLNSGYRVSGITKLMFSPAIEAKFIKFTTVDTTYTVGGGSPWAVSEIRPLTVSGINFFPEDNTDDAEFHEWKLVYEKEINKVSAYIDDNLITTSTFAGSLKDSRLMLLHDLTPSSGTHTDFHGEFRDIEIVYPGTALSTGAITALDVIHNQLGSGNPNYTVMSASTKSLVIADYDLGASPEPDLVRTFGHDVIFGDAEFVPVIVPESEAHRDDGLVFVGTSVYTPAVYRRRIKRPSWFERWSSAAYYQYGRLFAWCYHPVEDKLFILQDNSSTFFLLTDINTRRSVQVSRVGYRDASNTANSTPLNPDTVKLVYATYNDRIWLYSSGNILVSIEAFTGAATRVTFSDSADGASVTGGRYFITYALHNHKIVCGTNFLHVVDVPTSTPVRNPLNLAANGMNWGRAEVSAAGTGAGDVPWSPLTGGTSADVQDHGTAVACYSEYDKTVYLLGSPNANFHNTVSFCKFHIDKNYIEVIDTGTEASTWPVSDATLSARVPVPIVLEKTTNMAYDSRRRRIYVLSLLGPKALLFYFDVVNQVWVDAGFSPPFVDMADWPNSSTTIDTNHIVYDSQNDRLLIATGTSGDEGAYIYELYDDRDAVDVGFDYQPIRDGLPGTTPETKHFTTMSGIKPDSIVTSAGWNRDFYYTSAINSTTRYYNWAWSSTGVTVSGNNPGSYTDGGGDVYEIYVSSEAVDPVKSFELSAKVSLPLFTRGIFKSSNVNGAFPAAAHFIMGMSDGINRPWVRNQWPGQKDPNIYQSVELRLGVQGVFNSTASRPLRAHVIYVDGFNADSKPADNVSLWTTRPLAAYDSYNSGAIDLGSAFSDFRDFRLTYDYETDTVTGYVDGVTCGSTKLRRKFSSGGVRFHLGFFSQSENDSANGHKWMARFKDLEWKTKAHDRVEDGRLITSISGSVGSYIHERFDQTIASGLSWIYSTETYYPTSKRFSGFDYIATVGAMADGHKLAELVTFMTGTQKRIGIVGNPDTRHLSSTYLATANYTWDDRETGKYTMIKDLYDDSVRVYLDNSETPVIDISYHDLPASKNQHMYYGKVNYGAWERIFESMSLVGSWTTGPNLTGTADPDIENYCFNGNGRFATVTQGTAARATFAITAGLGDVDVYCFYVATATDGVTNAPFTITSESIVALPTAVGTGQCVASILTETDEFGAPNSNKTTLKIDQRRVLGGILTSTNRNLSQGSGWIHLGKYRNPTSVVVTASASVNGSSTQGFVCADAIGVDIGKYGRSTFESQVRRVRYRTDAITFAVPYEEAGLTVVDLQSNTVIDSYGELTAPAFLDSNITSGIERE